MDGCTVVSCTQRVDGRHLALHHSDWLAGWLIVRSITFRKRTTVVPSVYLVCVVCVTLFGLWGVALAARACWLGGWVPVLCCVVLVVLWCSPVTHPIRIDGVDTAEWEKRRAAQGREDTGWRAAWRPACLPACLPPMDR